MPELLEELNEIMYVKCLVCTGMMQGSKVVAVIIVIKWEGRCKMCWLRAAPHYDPG